MKGKVFLTVLFWTMVLCSANGQTIDEERSALMALYNATNGDHWTHHENWGSNKPLGQWYGVTTDNTGHVTQLELEQNNLDGSIPKEIGKLKRVWSLNLASNSLKGTLDSAIGEMKSLNYLYLYSNQLSGAVPEELGNITWLSVVALYENQFSGTLDVFCKLKQLNTLSVASNHFTGSIPDGFSDLKELTTLILADNQLSGELPESLSQLEELIVLMVQDNNLTGTIPESYVNSSITGLWINGNRMRGIISETIVNSDWWNNLHEVYYDQQAGYGLTFNYYTSSDYSKDGEVVQLHTHTKGQGVPIVVLGDGFSDRKIASGEYDGRVNEVVSAFFALEPFASLLDYFDVYTVYAVSEYEVSGENTKFLVSPKIQIPEEGMNRIKEYVLKISSLDGSLKDVTTLLIPSSNPPLFYGLTYYATTLKEGMSIALTPIRDVTKDINTYLVQHEGGGHAFGCLADEHMNDDATREYSESQKQELDEFHKYGYSLNIDYHDTAETVLWKDFLSNPDYAVEGLGLYEGAEYAYAKGVFRPSEESIMNTSGQYYNAPSRWAIYQRVMKLSGEKCTFDDFLLLDKKFLATLSTVKGDVNGDNTVNQADIKEVVDYILGRPSEKFNRAAADVNSDGFVNAADIVAIISIIISASSFD